MTTSPNSMFNMPTGPPSGGPTDAKLRIISGGILAFGIVLTVGSLVLEAATGQVYMAIIGLAPLMLVLGITGLISPDVVRSMGQYGGHLPAYYKVIGWGAIGLSLVLTVLVLIRLFAAGYQTDVPRPQAWRENPSPPANARPVTVETKAAQVNAPGVKENPSAMKLRKTYPVSIAVPENSVFVPANAKLTAGTRLEACWSRKWNPITTLSENEDGSINVRWDTFGPDFDCSMVRSELIIRKEVLRHFGDFLIGPASVTTTGPETAKGSGSDDSKPKPLAADGPVWLRNVDEAKRAAKKDAKDLLIVFTGHGWCKPCELMDREIFRKSAFADAADKAYVFVELDFNFADSAEGRRRATDFDTLKAAYMVHAFPTVVLADSTGSVYAILTGYDKDLDAAAYLKISASARVAKTKRDYLLMTAVGKSGESRAVLLDKAITCIEPMLGSLDDRGEDPVLHFYGPVVEEILALTALSDAQHAVSEKYLSRRRRRDERASKQALFAKVDDFLSTKNYAGAIGFIEQSMEATEDPRTRWELEYKKQVYLQWSDRNEDALANCRRLLAIKSLTDADRESLLDFEAQSLFRLGRLDECIDTYDKRIAAADLTPAKKSHLLHGKAQRLLGGDRIAESIRAWRVYRESTEQGTDDWCDATALLARELRRDRRHEDAIKLIRELLPTYRHPWVLLDAAESCFALNDGKAAMSFIEECRTLNSKFAKSERKGERDLAERVEARIKRMMEMASTNLPKPSGEEADRTKR